jgi:PilZ domain
MTANLVRVERRVGQRFPYLLPLSLRQPGTSLEGLGFTQDLSARGAFFFTDAPVQVGDEIEITLRMPSEITLGDSMPVRCRGRILRVVRPSPTSSDGATAAAQTRIGVAVRFECYEYLAEAAAAASASYTRISALHTQSQPEEERP